MKYAILISLYLSRSGRADLLDICENLSLELKLLKTVANKLTKGKILDFIAGEGYELAQDTKFSDLFECVEPVQFLKKQDYYSHANSSVEQRALALYSVNLGMSIVPLLNRKIRNVMQELIANEVAVLDKFNISGLEN